jgi:hypothetical protein
MRSLDVTRGASASLLGWLIAMPGISATVTNINSTITNAGSCTLTSTCPENYGVANYNTTTQVVDVPPQGSFGFTDSFNQSGNTSTGSNLGPSATGAGGPWNFEDNILFSTNGAAVQAEASATLTNVTDLQARVILLANPNNGGLPFDITSASSAQALLGGNTVVTIEDGWTNFANPLLGVDYTGTLPNSLAAGSYILQIRGEAMAGSSYSGTIDFSPVPIPATVWLVVSGLAGLGVVLARSRHRLGVSIALSAA